MRLRNKVAIVTGGSQGIGRGIVKMFAEEGATVVIADINSETGDLTETELQEENLQVTFHRTDVGNEDDVKELIRFTAGRFGSVDVLVNNAAVNYRKAVHETSLDEWNSLMDVNLTGAFLCSKYAIPEMQKQDGASIINIISWHAETTITRLAAYASAKGGLAALTRQMALDYGKDQIRVNAVGPSTVDTPMLQKTFDSLENPEKAMEESLEFIPMGRFGTVEDIAKACLFFASDDSAFISGQTLMVDGGQINKVSRPIDFD
ncbi:SDR family NAD(P)-dependent oxidoreductase [Lacicoccus alkaliphilus]|uniref:NAD(P)-dependent dehydrogenase, short-chain alcohol dehydrogenase family n=1 Tax=Lacicoccus alkaliphilus DSM 16010 TaxID=1123231 RepID=A0A1M7DT28_9BACL|nr:glucose 1-dehydrogenase [Salinicoccus alkaliphilus]SHL82577.1 NAD(P)-dependent dehydrogenase, short-chain alcohol dehydrogenase family [Salinicoccus alkaliphilus DSM 16010]